MEPGQPTTIHWIGDCRAYGWDGAALTQWSTDQTMGQYLRRNGVAVELTAAHDNWSRTGLAQAGAALCRVGGDGAAGCCTLPVQRCWSAPGSSACRAVLRRPPASSALPVRAGAGTKRETSHNCTREGTELHMPNSSDGLWRWLVSRSS